MSQLEVDKIIPQSGTTLTIGDSGDTISFAEGTNLGIDTNTLVIDSTNNRVGIKNASPTVELDVTGSVAVSGTVTATSFSGDGSSLTGITSVGGATGVDFNDNVKARFGTGNDLEIYHDGSHSYISDQGTGNLVLQASNSFKVENSGGTETYIFATENGAVELKHDNSTKIATTSTGVDVTGTVTATGNLTSLGIDDNATATSLTIASDGRTTLDATNDKPLVVHHTDGAEVKIGFSNNAGSASYMSLDGSDFTFNQVGSETMRINSSGNIGIGDTSPLGKVHINTGGSATSVNANADELVLEGSGNSGMTIISGNTSTSTIFMTDPDDTNVGAIQYEHNLNQMDFKVNDAYCAQFNSSGHFLPHTTNTFDIGSSSKVWRNIYTSDFHMSNEGLDKGNDIDGTKGSWTFQEGEENLYLINNKNGKKYKFNLTEIE